MTLTAPPRDPFLERPERPGRPSETEQARTARLALRRRLLVWSLPVVLVVLAVALKLLTMVALGHQARSAWDEGNITSLQSAGERLGVLNLLERHKAPFALGDAKVLAGDLDGARGDQSRGVRRRARQSARRGDDEAGEQPGLQPDPAPRHAHPVDQVGGQQVGVSRLEHRDPAQHLPHDDLDVLVVDRHAL